MSDQLGALSLPASDSDDPIGDPALARLAAFLAVVINKNAANAWLAVEPAPSVSQQPAIKTVLLQDPEQDGFNDDSLPALFVWRQRGKLAQDAQDRLDDISTIHVFWVSPARPREEQRARKQFTRVIVASIAQALALGRDPDWVDANDSDPTAAPVAQANASFLLAKAMQTSPITYSGAGLDGARGANPLNPALGLEIHLAAASSGTPYNTTTPIAITYLDLFGQTTVAQLQPTVPAGPETLTLGASMSQLVSVGLPPQLAATGQISVGNPARTGRGSSLFGRTEFTQVTLGEWKTERIGIEALDGDQRVDMRIPYTGIRLMLEVVDTLSIDTSDTTRFPLGTTQDASIAQGNGAFTVERRFGA